MAKAMRHARSAPAAPKHKNPSHKGGPTPNLLVTIDEGERTFASKKVLALLARAGYPQATLTPNPGIGIVGVCIEGADPRDCVPKLHALFLDTPFAFHNTHRWIPLEAWTTPEAAELSKFAKLASAEIGRESSWAIALERHGSHLDRGLVVNTIAKGIDNPHVSLDAPQKTVVVELVGNKAGLAVLEESQQMSVDRGMRDEFVEFQEVVVPFQEDR